MLHAPLPTLQSNSDLCPKWMKCSRLTLPLLCSFALSSPRPYLMPAPLGRVNSCCTGAPDRPRRAVQMASAEGRRGLARPERGHTAAPAERWRPRRRSASARPPGSAGQPSCGPKSRTATASCARFSHSPTEDSPAGGQSDHAGGSAQMSGARALEPGRLACGPSWVARAAAPPLRASVSPSAEWRRRPHPAGQL